MMNSAPMSLPPTTNESPIIESRAWYEFLLNPHLLDKHMKCEYPGSSIGNTNKTRTLVNIPY